MTPPPLQENDIRQEVEHLFVKSHRSKLVALYGSGEAGEVEIHNERWQVVPTRCELELRAQMPAPGEKVRKIFLIDWTDRSLPLDLACRFARGHVRQISRDSRLAALFGARQAEASLVGTGLASVLLSGEVAIRRKVAGIEVSRTDAFRAFLDAWLDLDLGETLELPALLAWVALNDRGPALEAKAAESENWRRLQGELRDLVEKLAGKSATLARAAWMAWEQNLGRRLVQLLVLVDASRQREDALGRGILIGQLHSLGPGFGSKLLEAPEQLDAWLVEVQNRIGSEGWWQSMVEEAEGLITQAELRPTLEASRWLPAGLVARTARLAAELRALVSAPSSGAGTAVVDALKRVEEHRSSERQDDSAREIRRRGVALSLWLIVRRERPIAGEHGPNWQVATDLGRRFVEEGGYVDWCRQVLRRPLLLGTALNEAFYEVLKAADAARREDDALFAKGLMAWVEAGRPSSEVLPIDAVLREMGAGLLLGGKHRKLLVVLMDGMSWANAVQLLTHLGQNRWGPVAWKIPSVRGQAQFPVVFAELPTVTAQSRAAFFAGKHDKTFGDQPTSQDAKRWRDNRCWSKVMEGKPIPELVLKSGLMREEDLDREVKRAIESDARVVGVVVNAIDEQLKGSSQLGIDYSRVPIKPLEGLLQAAAGADRIVLLASDHGHVPGDGMQAHGQLSGQPREGGRRWRPVRSQEALLPFEVRLPKDTWCPAGTEGIGVIWDEKQAHGAPQFGEHGGVSMAEVIAPTLLIAPDWLEKLNPLGGDPEIGVRPVLYPEWWELKVAGPAPVVARPPAVPARPTNPVLFAPPEPMHPQPQEVPDLIAKLQKSSIFKKQVEGRGAAELERILRCLRVLAVELGGSLSEDEFARRCQLVRRHVAGVIAQMGVLNCDGFTMVEHNIAGQQVVLHRQRLIQQYGLEE